MVLSASDPVPDLFPVMPVPAYITELNNLALAVPGCVILNSLPTSPRPGLGMAKLNERKIKWIVREIEKESSNRRSGQGGCT